MVLSASQIGIYVILWILGIPYGVVPLLRLRKPKHRMVKEFSGSQLEGSPMQVIMVFFSLPLVIPFWT